VCEGVGVQMYSRMVNRPEVDQCNRTARQKRWDDGQDK